MSDGGRAAKMPQLGQKDAAVALLLALGATMIRQSCAMHSTDAAVCRKLWVVTPLHLVPEQDDETSRAETSQ